MIASKVRSDAQVRDWLFRLDFETTKHKTKTGKFWKCKTTDGYIQIPNSIDGFRPDWQIHEIEEIIRKFRR